MANRERFDLPENSKVLVPYSGGADSLALLTMLLLRGNQVITCYIQASQGPTKVFAEMAKRKVVFDLIRSGKLSPINGDFFVRDIEINISNSTITDRRNVTSPSNHEGMLRQPFDWIYGLGLAARAITEVDYIAIGWVQGDSAIPHMHEFTSALENMLTLSLPFARKIPKIVFPLVIHGKEGIYAHLTNLFRGMSYDDYFWTCEFPVHIENTSQFKPCEICVPCVALKKAMLSTTHQFIYSSTRQLAERVIDIKPDTDSNSHTVDSLERGQPTLYNYGLALNMLKGRPVTQDGIPKTTSVE